VTSCTLLTAWSFLRDEPDGVQLAALQHLAGQVLGSERARLGRQLAAVEPDAAGGMTP